MDQEKLPSAEEVAQALQAQEELEEVRLLETEEERKIGMKLIPIIRQAANASAEAVYAKRLNAVVDELKASNMKLIEAEVQKIRDAAKPPDPKELEKLLSQEYMTFTLKVADARGAMEREFVIRELPQAKELKLAKVIQTTLVPRLKDFASIEWNSTASQAEKIQKLIDLVPETLDMLAECCSIALDPYEDQGITKAWVQANLSSNRIMHIIQAQITAGRFRDFFSALYRTIPETRTA